MADDAADLLREVREDCENALNRSARRSYASTEASALAYDFNGLLAFIQNKLARAESLLRGKEGESPYVIVPGPVLDEVLSKLIRLRAACEEVERECEKAMERSARRLYKHTESSALAGDFDGLLALLADKLKKAREGAA